MLSCSIVLSAIHNFIIDSSNLQIHFSIYNKKGTLIKRTYGFLA